MTAGTIPASTMLRLRGANRSVRAASVSFLCTAARASSPPRRPCAHRLHRQRRRRAATSPHAIGEHRSGAPAARLAASVPSSCPRLHSTRARPSRSGPAVPPLSGCGRRSSLRVPIFSLGAGQPGYGAPMCPLLRKHAAARCHARRWRELPLPTLIRTDARARMQRLSTAVDGVPIGYWRGRWRPNSQWALLAR